MNTPRAVRITSVVLSACALLLLTSSAWAIDKCKVKVDKKTGVINVDANVVGGPLTWGPASGQETNVFFNNATCNVAGKAKKCQLAAPAALASKTAPSGCTIYLTDGVLPCSAWIPGCSPGARSDTGALVKDANGAVLGIAADGLGQSALRDDGGATVRLQLATDGSGFFTYNNFFYASADCTGPTMMFADTAMVRAVYALGTTGHYAPPTASNQPFASALYVAGFSYVDQTACDTTFGPGNSTYVAPGGCCFPTVGVLPLGTTSTIDLSIFTPPFTVELQ